MNSRRFGRGTPGVVVLAIVVIAAAIGLAKFTGIGGWGPTYTVTATVQGKHVDISKSEDSTTTHYMVATDKGGFEVDNGILLGIWNADEIYGSLQENKTYTFTVKGNRYVSWYGQYYPYIVSAKLEE